MPSSTAAAAVVNSRLLSSRLPSREMGWNTPVLARLGPRQANSASEPPMTTRRRTKMKTPRAGSVAKAWTDVSTPDRTKNVPSRLRAKVTMARKRSSL